MALESRTQQQDLFGAVRQNAQEIVILIDPGTGKLRHHRRGTLVALFPARPALAVFPRFAPTTLAADELPSPGQMPGLSFGYEGGTIGRNDVVPLVDILRRIGDQPPRMRLVKLLILLRGWWARQGSNL